MATGPETSTRPARADDAPGLVQLVARCYGDTYPGSLYGDAQALRRLIERGDLGGVVAVAGARLIGHIAIRPAGGEAAVCEAGTTIVDPEQRGRGVMRMLAIELAAECLRRGLAGFIHFPTTAHDVMQRASISAGGRETGILLGYVPATTADATIGRSEEGRLAVTVVYQPLAPAPARTGFVPARYRSAIAGLAAELGLERRWESPAPAPAGQTSLERVSDPARGLERTAIAQVGDDIVGLAPQLAAVEAELVHVDLPMSDPAIERATGALLNAGFVYGAWLPGWAGSDVLRLQRVRDPFGAHPPLASPAAATLLQLIHADAAAHRGAAVTGRAP